jgi:hypothetical protein
VEFGGKGQKPHPLKAEPFGQRPQDKGAAPGGKSKTAAGCRRYQSEKRREISPLREPTRSQEANAKKRRRLASVEMTVWVVGVGDLSWLKPRATKRVERKNRSRTSVGMTGLLEIRKRKMEVGGSGGAVEFEGGGVAEGVEDAEHQVGGNVDGVAVHDGGDAGA